MIFKIFGDFKNKIPLTKNWHCTWLQSKEEAKPSNSGIIFLSGRTHIYILVTQVWVLFADLVFWSQGCHWELKFQPQSSQRCCWHHENWKLFPEVRKQKSTISFVSFSRPAMQEFYAWSPGMPKFCHFGMAGIMQCLRIQSAMSEKSEIGQIYVPKILY